MVPASTAAPIAVVGAGPVGLVATIALARVGMPVALLGPDPRPGCRHLALATSSRRILRALGVWPHLAAHAQPVQSILVSSSGQWGKTHLTGADLPHPPLAHIVAESALLEALQTTLDALPGNGGSGLMRDRRPVTGFSQDASGITLVNGGEAAPVELVRDAPLALAAVGGDQSLPASAGLTPRRRHSDRVALCATLQTSAAHHGRAHERFTRQGPIALLPLGDPAAHALVWTLPTADGKALGSAAPPDMLAALQRAFGWLAGRFVHIGERHLIPLEQRWLEQPFNGRLLFIGNAANTLHPVAGQGLNLALRDVATLIELLVTHLPPAGPGRELPRITVPWPTLPPAWAARRQADWRLTRWATQSLPALFGATCRPLSLARSAGLSLLDMQPALRGALVRRASGLLRGAGALERGWLP